MDNLGVPWLDLCVLGCMEDEHLQHHFGLVSDGLGSLVGGSYGSKNKRALLTLLGPSFVWKHFSSEDRIKITQSEDSSQGWPPVSSKIKRDLEDLSNIALGKHFPPEARNELRGRIKGKILESLQWEISSRYREGDSDQGSSKSLTLCEEEDYDEILAVLGKSIESLIDFDEENQLNLNLMIRAKDVFRNNHLAIPPELRRHLWFHELENKSSKIPNKPDCDENLFSENVKLGKQ